MGPELSDVIVAHHPDTLARVPVRHAAAHATFAEEPWALRVLRTIPHDGPYLASDAVDDLLVRAHTELQRLHDEFQHAARVLRLLRPLVQACRDAGHVGPIRVVDLGCGLGSVVRTLAHLDALGPDVELLGCDFNTALIAAAASLARAEALPCRFAVANALALDTPATILLSTGVVHHFRGPALARFFEAQAHPATLATVHYDITPTWAAPIGAWLFHMARMREPLARHDGIRSALRAHPDDTLATAARTPGRAVAFFERPSPWLPMLRVLRPVITLRHDLLAPLVRHLGPLARHLHVLAGRP